jgi:hypothetical protein
MFETLRRENAKEDFGNMVSVANESAVIRDIMLEEMEADIDVDLNDPDAEEKFKNQALDEEEMDELIEKIPETEIDDAAIAVGKLTNQNVPIDEEEYIGAPLEEAMREINYLIPDTEEV